MAALAMRRGEERVADQVVRAKERVVGQVSKEYVDLSSHSRKQRLEMG